MKILMICNTPVEEGGGAESFCVNLSEHLISSGMESTIVFGKDAEYASSNNIPKISNVFLRKVFFDYINPLALRKFKSLLSEIKPDIVHFHNIYGISSQLIQHSVSSGFGTVLTVHDKWPICYRPMLSSKSGCPKECRFLFSQVCFIHRKIRLSQLRGVSIVSPSKFMMKELERVGFSRIHHIPNGIQIPDNVAEENRRAFFVGRIDRSKGSKMLAKIALELEQYDIPLDVAGTGPDVISITDKRNLHYFGYLDRTRLNSFYEKGGVLLFLSEIEENFPMTILEALSFGIPIVALDRGGVTELVIDGRTGVIVDNDPKTIVSNITKILDNQEFRNGLSRNARNIANKFTWNKIVDAYINLYKSIMSH